MMSQVRGRVDWRETVFPDVPDRAEFDLGAIAVARPLLNADPETIKLPKDISG